MGFGFWFAVLIVGVLVVASVVSYIIDPDGYFDDDDFYWMD